MTSSGEQPIRPQRVSRDRDAYEPPRIEVVGTIDELTMGGVSPVLLDASSLFGTVAVCDRRLKQAIEPLDARFVLGQLGAASGYGPALD